MAFMTSQGGAVNALSDLITILADPKKVAKQLEEFKKAEQAGIDTLEEIAVAQKMLEDRKASLDKGEELVIRGMKSNADIAEMHITNENALFSKEATFERVKSDFEALKSQTMNEFKVSKDEANAALKALKNKETELSSISKEQTKVSLALDEREKTLLDQENKAQELIDLYNSKLAQLKSLV